MLSLLIFHCYLLRILSVSLQNADTPFTSSPSKCSPSLDHLNAHGNSRARSAFIIAGGDRGNNNRGFLYIKEVFINRISVSGVADEDKYVARYTLTDVVF